MKTIEAGELKVGDRIYDKDYYATQSGRVVTDITFFPSHIEVATGVSVRPDFDTRTKFIFHKRQAVMIF